MAEKDKSEFYKTLINQGVSRKEIDGLYRKLREKGYGDEAAERRFQEAVKRLKDSRDLDERRTGTAQENVFDEGDERFHLVDISLTEQQSRGEFWKDTESFRRRAEDWLPRIHPSLRRKINKWAFRNNLGMIGFRERFSDFLTYFNPHLKDYVSDDFIRLLLMRRDFRSVNPYEFGILETIDALFHTSRFLLGRERKKRAYLAWGKLKEIETNIGDALRRRDHFGYEFLLTFTSLDEKLMRSLDFIEVSFHSGKRIEFSSLIRLVKQLYRLVMITEQVPDEKIAEIITIAKDVNLAFDKSRSLFEELESAENLFRIAFSSLRILKREYYPALLKMINGFFEEGDLGPEKMHKIFGFLEIREDSILNYPLYRQQEEKRKEKLLMEEQKKDSGPASPVEESDSFSVKFHDILSLFDILFPGSSFDNIENYPDLLPYFDSVVFRRTLMFYHQGASIENVHRKDPMGQIMIIHRILDNFLNSLNEFNLERILDRPGMSETLLQLKHDWSEVYIRLFEPYLSALSAYSRECEGTEDHIRSFRESQRSRAIEEELNTFRNHCIKDYGRVVVKRDIPRAPKLYALATNLAGILTQAGKNINKDIVKKEDIFAQKIYHELSAKIIVDYRLHADQGSLDYKPATHQIKRYIEARYRCAIEGVPKIAQILFLDIFREAAELYRYLLNEEGSFYRRSAEHIVIAGSEEVSVWEKVKTEALAVSLEIPYSMLNDEMKSEYIDFLTGLLSKNYFLQELPKKVRQMQQQGKALSLAMLDIDHFKWINDELGHQTGDDALKSSAQVIVDNIRKEQDVAIRFGGEEIVLLLQESISDAEVRCERIRLIQEQRIAGEESLRDIREIGERRGETCGTFSIGMSSIEDSKPLETAVAEADQALYAAKKKRNSLALHSLHP